MPAREAPKPAAKDQDHAKNAAPKRVPKQDPNVPVPAKQERPPKARQELQQGPPKPKQAHLTVEEIDAELESIQAQLAPLFARKKRLTQWKAKALEQAQAETQAQSEFDKAVAAEV